MPMDLREVVATIESGNWISMSVVTANVQRGTGGKVLHLAKVKIAREQPRQPGQSAGVKKQRDKKRDANHNLHFTRNVETQHRDIITIHPILVFRINGEDVL